MKNGSSYQGQGSSDEGVGGFKDISNPAEPFLGLYMTYLYLIKYLHI